MLTFDLLNLPPLPVTEAKSRDDLDRVMRSLRRGAAWSRAGMPREDILDEVDDEFIHHRDHYNKLVGTAGEGGKGGKGIKAINMRADQKVCEITVDGSQEWIKGAHDYRARIKFSNYGTIRKLPEHNWPEKARLLLRDNLLVDCTCKAFRFYHRHAATAKGFALVQEKRPAKINNPQNRGGVCKHLEHALRYLGSNYPVIASAMKKHHLGETMNILDRINAVITETGDPDVDAGSIGEKFEGGYVPKTGHDETDALIAAAGGVNDIWRHSGSARVYSTVQLDATKLRHTAIDKGWRYNGKGIGGGDVYTNPSKTGHLHLTSTGAHFHIRECASDQDEGALVESANIVNNLIGEAASTAKHTFSHADLYDLLTANGHNVHQWRDDPMNLKSYADTVINNHRVDRERAAKGANESAVHTEPDGEKHELAVSQWRHPSGHTVINVMRRNKESGRNVDIATWTKAGGLRPADWRYPTGADLMKRAGDVIANARKAGKVSEGTPAHHVDVHHRSGQMGGDLADKASRCGGVVTHKGSENFRASFASDVDASRFAAVAKDHPGLRGLKRVIESAPPVTPANSLILSINGALNAAQAAGMSKTVAALRMAADQAGLEGAPASPVPSTPDDRVRPAPNPDR